MPTSPTTTLEIVESIDWVFRRFAQRKRAVGRTLRSAFFDVLASGERAGWRFPSARWSGE